MADRISKSRVKAYLQRNGFRESEEDFLPLCVFYKEIGRPDEPIIFVVDDEGFVDAEDWERIKRTITRLLHDSEDEENP